MNELLAIVIVLFIALIGSMTIVIFNLLPKQNPISLLCYGYGLGAGLLATQLFFYARLGIEYSSGTLIIPWLVFAFIGFLKKNKYEFEKYAPPKLRKMDFLFLILICLLLFFVLFESILRPVTAWDAFSSWMLKSKVFYVDGGIIPGIFQYIDSDYPMIIGLMGTYFYTVLGNLNDRLLLITSAAFYLAMSGIFFFWLRERIGFTIALLFAFLLLSTQNLIRHGGRYEAGQADLALGYYVLAASFLLLDYIQSRNVRILVLCAIFLGILSLIKNEGMFFALSCAGVGVWYILKKRLYLHLFAFLFFVIPVIDWQAYKLYADVPKLPHYITFTPHVSRGVTIVRDFITQMFSIQNWNLLWIGFIFSIVLWSHEKKTYQTSIILFLILFQLLVYFAVFIVTRVDPTEHIQNVFDRLLIHIAPLATVFIALVASSTFTVFPIFKKYFYEKV